MDKFQVHFSYNRSKLSSWYGTENRSYFRALKMRSGLGRNRAVQYSVLHGQVHESLIGSAFGNKDPEK